jgi:hypothetical protein
MLIVAAFQDNPPANLRGACWSVQAFRMNVPARWVQAVSLGRAGDDPLDVDDFSFFDTEKGGWQEREECTDRHPNDADTAGGVAEARSAVRLDPAA